MDPNAETVTETTTSADTTTTTTEGAAVEAVSTEAVETTTENTEEEGTLLTGIKPGEEAPAEGEAPAGAPEAYEIAVKDADGNDVPLDAEITAEASEVFREFNLTNEQANKLAPLAVKVMERTMAAAEEAQTTALMAARKQWADEFKADPDMGGAKVEETLHLAAKGMDALGFVAGHPFRELLDVSGLGNHPDMIRTFLHLGKVTGEDSFVAPDGAAENQPVGWTDLYKNDGKE